jgi:hypothetical protein
VTDEKALRRALPLELAVLADLLFSAFILALVLLKNSIVSVRRRAPWLPRALEVPLFN